MMHIRWKTVRSSVLLGHRAARSLAGLLLLLAAGVPGWGCAGHSLPPAPNLYWATGEHPFDGVPEIYRTPVAEILYATDRQKTATGDDRVWYGWKRSHSLAMGTCSVMLGDGKTTWEDLVLASTTRQRSRSIPVSVREVHELSRLPPSNTPRQMIDGEMQITPEYAEALDTATAEFQAIVRERLALTPRKEVYIFVHGFNNTFEDAAYRMAELWHFLGRQGVPLLYTWPAGRPGLMRGYNYDRESSDFTVFHLKQLIRILSDIPEMESFHVIGHSRGTDVVMTTIREFWIEMRGAGLESTGRLKSVIIAAPDLDWEVTQQRISAENIPAFARNFVLYLCEEDRAIGLSSWLFSSLRRLGQLGASDLTPEQRKHIAEQTEFQVVDAKVGRSGLGHSYFIGNPAVLSDLILVLRDGKQAGAENGRPLTREGDGFWTITDTYLVEQ